MLRLFVQTSMIFSKNQRISQRLSNAQDNCTTSTMLLKMNIYVKKTSNPDHIIVFPIYKLSSIYTLFILNFFFGLDMLYGVFVIKTYYRYPHIHSFVNHSSKCLKSITKTKYSGKN